MSRLKASNETYFDGNYVLSLFEAKLLRFVSSMCVRTQLQILEIHVMNVGSFFK